jgi:hypothetical protein
MTLHQMSRSQILGNMLVCNQIIQVGHWIKIQHRYRGMIEGYVLNYDGCILVIKLTGDSQTTYINKGLITKIINNQTKSI